MAISKNNPAEKSAFLKSACDSGSGESCSVLGEVTEAMGSVDQAKSFYEKACDLEFAIGCDQAASVWSDQKNERKSFHFAERGCQLKNHMSCARIAHTKNNIQEQFDILSVSCSNFEGMACFAIAEGLSTLPNPDPKNLKRLYSLSCKLGVAAGCEKVGESLPKFFTGQ